MSNRREDHQTNTVEDAAQFEQDRGREFDYDDRPTKAEIEAEEIHDGAWRTR